jgi:DNA-directed RNA polymerase subunit M/transcription elongation factor TFIIS
MSTTRLFQHELTCDYCDYTEIITNRVSKVYAEDLPPDWEMVVKKYYDCGLTGYTQTEYKHKCPRCRNKE